MTTTDLTEFQARKKAIREEAHKLRNALPEKDPLSLGICQILVDSDEYKKAKTILWYLDARSEVRTRHFIPTALQSDKKIIVPYCVDGFLHLFHLKSMDDLSVGMYKILEPKTELRDLPEHRVEVQDIDLIVVPGVAFDRRGARMGHGFGYYDKLLEHARKDTPFIALAFECQLFPEIPTAPHDMFMDKLITEKTVYQGLGRKGS